MEKQEPGNIIKNMDTRYQFSFYESPLISKKHLHHQMSLSEFLNGIKKGIWKSQVEALRNTSDAKQAEKLKTALPYVTLSAVMENGKRSKDAVLEHSGLLQIDIDAKNNFQKNAAEIKELIKDDIHLFACFLSPTGTGVKAVASIPKNIDEHAAAFLAAETYFIEHYGLFIDKSCKDASRAFFVSYDPETAINATAKKIELRPSLPLTASKKHESSAIYKPSNLMYDQMNETENDKRIRHINDLCNKVESLGTDMTNDYNFYLRIGFAIGDGLGEAGREYYHRLCKNYADYDSKKTDKHFDNCQKPGGVKWASLFGIAKDFNIIVYPNSISGNTHENNGASDVGKIAPIKNERQNAHEITDRERIENSISSIFEIRKNIIFDRVEYRMKHEKNAEWEPANEDDISRELEMKSVKNCSPQRIKSIIRSKFVKQFNPFTQYFENLPHFDKMKEPDYIKNLSNIVQLKDEPKDRERFDRHFKKALVRCVACALPNDLNNLNYNKHAIVFISPAHSIGKSGFVRYLIPDALKMYCIEDMDFGTRDEQFTMQSSFIINLDEMASIEEKNLQKVKSAMSKGVINVRKMNSGERLIEPRRCSFFGSTNNPHILKSDTGTVRWLCFYVIGFNLENRYWEKKSPLYVDINKVWGQAYTLFKEGFSFQLTKKEEAENEAANENFKEASIEDELIAAFLKPGAKTAENHKPTFEIMEYLACRNPASTKSITLKKLGSALLKAGFELGSQRKTGNPNPQKGYWVSEI